MFVGQPPTPGTTGVEFHEDNGVISVYEPMDVAYYALTKGEAAELAASLLRFANRPDEF